MAAQAKTVTAGEIEVLEYPACPGAGAAPEWNGWAETDESGRTGPVQAGARGASSSEQSADEARQSFESGRERGRQEGRQAEREAQGTALTAEAERYKRQLTALASRFSEERDRYLAAVEQEVVKLALALAARILRREAQMDPLLLTGAVRVALGQLAGSSEVELRVPAAELELWKEAIAHLPHVAMKPVVAAGEGMRLGDCVIESKVGTVDLGVRSQLAEIERGFFDRAGSAAVRAKGAIPSEVVAAPDTGHDADQVADRGDAGA
jgi:flagellar biosynthesis/type III secretory pathway protein FliH